MNCSRCQAPLAPGMTACPNCGLQFGQPVPGFAPAPPKKKNPGGMIALGCLGLFVVLIILGAIGNAISPTKTSPTTNTAASSTSTSAAAPDQAQTDNDDSSTQADAPAPTIAITAPELCSAYHKNEVSADEKYKDKLLKVTGTVGSIGKDITDTMYVTLNGTDEDLIGVQCMFDDQYKSKLLNLQKGQRITVTGTCDGSAIGADIILKDSSI